MPVRQNPFLERRLREANASKSPKPSKPSLFQQARDWTAFVVSLTSLVTAVIALRNTLTGPRPSLGGLAGEAVHLLRSDQFLLGSPERRGVVLRDEAGAQQEFPLLIVQPALANRAPPPNGVGVRSIEGDLSVSRQGKSLFRSSYAWYRLTASDIGFDAESGSDRIAFASAAQVSPFDLPGGSIWSREVLLIPRQTWAAVSWGTFETQLRQNCSEAAPCQGEFTLRVRLDTGVSLTEVCSFVVEEHVLEHIQGKGRRYFTSPQCRSATVG